MLLLRAFKDIWNEPPTNYNIKRYLNSKRELMGDKDFVDTMLYWFGGRGYNEFLDYSLLAIKFAYWYRENNIEYKDPSKKDCHPYETCRDIVTNLLWDDRHDMYQNVPFELDDLDLKGDFYKYFAKSIIECFNINGTGDVSVTMKVEE